MPKPQLVLSRAIGFLILVGMIITVGGGTMKHWVPILGMIFLITKGGRLV